MMKEPSADVLVETGWIGIFGNVESRAPLARYVRVSEFVVS